MSTIAGGLAIGQVGLVVKNLDEALEHYWHILGIGPWSIYKTGAPPLHCVYHGQPAQYQIKLATTRSGPLQMELIEYLSGDTIHRDFLAAGRAGLEHLGIFVPDLDAALQTYQEQGITVLQRAEGLGVNQDGRYAYLDTEACLGTILELIQSSSVPTPPERMYPVLY